MGSGNLQKKVKKREKSEMEDLENNMMVGLMKKE